MLRRLAICISILLFPPFATCHITLEEAKSIAQRLKVNPSIPLKERYQIGNFPYASFEDIYAEDMGPYGLYYIFEDQEGNEEPRRR